MRIKTDEEMRRLKVASALFAAIVAFNMWVQWEALQDDLRRPTRTRAIVETSRNLITKLNTKLKEVYHDCVIYYDRNVAAPTDESH